jgi:hypothetical protein
LRNVEVLKACSYGNTGILLLLISEVRLVARGNNERQDFTVSAGSINAFKSKRIWYDRLNGGLPKRQEDKMKKCLTIWFAVMFITIMACFAPGYCDDAPQSPGDSGVTDAVTPRFVKPGKMYEEKKDTAEAVKVEEPKKAPEPAPADTIKKAEDVKKTPEHKKLKATKKKLKANKVDGDKKILDSNAVRNDKK